MERGAETVTKVVASRTGGLIVLNALTMLYASNGTVIKGAEEAAEGLCRSAWAASPSLPRALAAAPCQPRQPHCPSLRRGDGPLGGSGVPLAGIRSYHHWRWARGLHWNLHDDRGASGGGSLGGAHPSPGVGRHCIRRRWRPPTRSQLRGVHAGWRWPGAGERRGVWAAHVRSSTSPRRCPPQQAWTSSPCRSSQWRAVLLSALPSPAS
ncbi:hypothetical protein CLOM_g2330 [Closterium sp. NIES-68]|nr:hypothetical protein CLOM_g2330 [Closterium sp. NIES-68]